LSSIDRPLPALLSGDLLREGLERRIAILCFGLAVAVGLVGAFVHLDGHSFWIDELFTARLLEPVAGTDLFGRIATDVHPPLYMAALWLHAQLFGTSDAALRGLSAAAACAAILVFITGTRAFFSLPARLFGAALATGTLFWFFQAQNARSYALCLLIGAAMMPVGLGLATSADRPGPWRRQLPVLALLMLAGSFVHFYVMYESLGLLLVLAVFHRRRLPVLAGLALILVLVAAAYVKLVIEARSQVALDSNWYLNTPAWYAEVLKASVRYTFGYTGVVALVMCVMAAMFGRVLARRSGAAVTTVTGIPLDPVTITLLGVPILVLAGGVISSTLLAPNFFDRNFLVVSPFIWGVSARLYDAAMEKAPPLVRIALASLLAILVLPTASIVMARLPSHEAPAFYEPFRSSAEWIRSLPACRGQIVPAISTDNPDWYKPGYAAIVYESAYGRYLEGFAQPQLVFTRDIAERLPTSLKADLIQRLDGQACPVLAWAAHNIDAEGIERVKARLLTVLGHDSAAPRIKVRAFVDGATGYVIYAEP
jgi:hypothetical protein